MDYFQKDYKLKIYCKKIYHDLENKLSIAIISHRRIYEFTPAP